MTMAKQRRSFFVDDILHKVMPVNASCTVESSDRKRKRSIMPEDDHRKQNESIKDEILNKKFRSYNNDVKHDNDNDNDDDDDDDEDEDEDDNGVPKDLPIVNVPGDGGGTGDESSNSDDSNSVNHYS
ncbi:unnamed protein product, partial [Rotaria socialis]